MKNEAIKQACDCVRRNADAATNKANTLSMSIDNNTTAIKALISIIEVLETRLENVEEKI